MSIRNMSGSCLGILIVVVALGFFAGCGDDNLAGNDQVAPAAPAGFHAAGSYSGIQLRWTGNSEADLAGYNVYAAMDGAALELVAVVPPTNTSYVQDAERDHEYTYEVTAIDQSSNESDPSATVTLMHNGQQGGGIRDNIGGVSEP